MTAPVITWRHIAGNLTAAYLGEVEIGRVHQLDNRASWFCRLKHGHSFGVYWTSARDEATAKAALEAAVREWCRAAGVAG